MIQADDSVVEPRASLQAMLRSTYPPATPMPIPSLDVTFEHLVHTYIEQRENVSLAVGILKDNHSSFNGFGQFSTPQPTVPDAQTLYEIGSITKVFTATILAALVKDGTVALDDSIRQHLPPQIAQGLPPLVQTITLRQLATHTSGLPRLPRSLLDSTTDPTNPYVHYTAHQLYADLEAVELQSIPGQHHAYSNLGMGVLGHLLSVKTGQTYEALVQSLIGQPLGMTDTTIHLTSDQQQRLVPGHSPDGTLTSSWDFDVLAPAGALRSSVKDMLAFLQANLRTMDHAVGEAIAQTHIRHFENDKGPTLGLAWHISPLPTGQVIYWHNGGTGGYISFMGFDLKHHLGVVMLSNYGDALANDASVDRMGVQLLMELSKTSDRPSAS